MPAVERRAGKRKECYARLSFFYRGKHREMHLLDASPTGGFLETSLAPPPGSVIVLESYFAETGGLRVRFVVEVVRTGDTRYHAASRGEGKRGIGARWKRAYCNRGAGALRRFIADVLGFEIEIEDFVRRHGEVSDGEVIYDFRRGECELRAPKAVDERSYRPPTPSQFMLIRDLPPTNVGASAERPSAQTATQPSEQAPVEREQSDSPPPPTARDSGPLGLIDEACDIMAGNLVKDAASTGSRAQATTDEEPQTRPEEVEAKPTLEHESADQSARDGAPRMAGDGPRAATDSADSPPNEEPGPEYVSTWQPTTTTTTENASQREIEPNDQRAAVRINVTYSAANRYHAGLAVLIGRRSLRLVTRAAVPMEDTRVVVRVPTSERESGPVSALVCKVVSEQEDSLVGGGATALELQILSIDDGHKSGAFRRFVKKKRQQANCSK